MSAEALKDTLDSLRAERDTLQGMVDAAAKRGTSTFSVEFRPNGLRITGPSDREEDMAGMLAGLLRTMNVIAAGRVQTTKIQALESLHAWLITQQGESPSLGCSDVLDEIEERVAALRPQGAA